MNICISISAENAADYKAALKALNEGAGLAELDLGNLLPEVKVAPVATKAAPAKTSAPVQAPVPSDEELPVPGPKAPQQAAVPDPNRVVGETPQQAAPKPVTLDALQTAGRKLAMAGHQDKLAAINAKYGAARLSEIPEASRAAALADLEAAND